MNAGEIKPRLYIVREAAEKSSDGFSKQYKAITDHLIEVIQRDGRLNLELKEFSKSDEFTDKVTELRQEVDFQDRPFAFLFIKPSPKKNEDSLEQAINELAEIADASMLHHQDGSEKPALASSVLFFNQLKKTQDNTSTYQDDLPLFKTIDFNEGNSIEIICDNFMNFRNLFISKPKLDDEITTYAKGLIDHVLAMHRAPASDKTTHQGRIHLGDEDTFDTLPSKDQDTILGSASWKELADENPRKTKFKIMLRFFNGANVGKIAAEFDINTSQINQTLNAFFSDPEGFIAK